MEDLLERLKAALAGRYAIEREIGSGGMATVYLAEDLKHHRQVALKVLRPELAAALGPERFLREIEIAAQLHHPHILPLYDSGEAHGFLYYVMPYVEGESLRDRLEREKQLAIDDALQAAREVADALSYAHSRGVIHRDIKPENILLESGHAVVADFGIARAIDQAGGEKLTGTGLTLGTPAYMSPEQAAGSKDLDGRSDLYSLGCVLYEMLAGQAPFMGPTVESMIHQHLTVEAPNITGVRPAVPAHVAATLERALSKTPADRFSPVALFAEALEPRGSVALTSASAAPVQRRFSWERMTLLAILVVVVAAGGFVAARRLLAPTAAGTTDAPRIVVLPFENLGAAEDEYFADGITDEITARLAALSSLSVISRQSAMQYKGLNPSMAEVGEELDVQYVLEGTIRWSRDGESNRVRVTPQLIKVDDDAHVWAKVFDEDLVEVFVVQSAIAGQVAHELGVVLDPVASRTLTKVPTSNLEAYDFYLRAKVYEDQSYGEAGIQVGANLCRRAIDLDPGFMEAYALLAHLHLGMYWFGYDRSLDRIALAKNLADSALTLSPDGAEAHLALGYYYYWGYRAYDEALRHFTRATELSPNDPESPKGLASVYRRQGRMEDARTEFERWVSLDPRSPTAAYNLAETYHLLHDFTAAREMLERAIALQPGFSWAPVELLSVLIGWRGDTIAAREVAQLATAREQPPGWPQRYWWFSGALYRILGMEYAAALQRIFAAEFGGDTVAALLARAQYAEARAYLEPILADGEGESRHYGQLAVAYAGLGRTSDAIREAQHAVEQMPFERDAFDGAEAVGNLAQVYAMTGDVARAVERLEILLSRPSRLTVAWLHLDPVWDPLRNDPRFQALLERYGNQ